MGKVAAFARTVLVRGVFLGVVQAAGVGLAVWGVAEWSVAAAAVLLGVVMVVAAEMWSR